MMIGNLIGKGATAEVYDYGNNKVIKLYNSGKSENSLKWEYNKMKAAHKNHVPCPEVFRLIEIDGRHGYIMEKYNGLTIKDKMFNEIQEVINGEMSIGLFSKNFFNDIKGVAKALYELHKIKVPEWEKLDDKLLWEVNSTDLLLAGEKEVIIDLIKKLPKDAVVCHLDTNPNNIMFCDGEYKFIDWVNAGTGNPLYDIAQYAWLSIPKEEANFEGVPQILIDFYLKSKNLIIPTFLSEYEKLSSRDISSYESYIIPLLVRKLHSNRTDKEKREIVLEIKNRLSKLS